MSQNNNNNNSNSAKAPWPVRPGVFKSIGQNDFKPNRSPSPIVEMPMSPSSARSSPARFIPGYNRSMSPRITIEESPFSPPPQTPTSVMSPPPFMSRHQSPPLLTRLQSPPPPPQQAANIPGAVSSPLSPPPPVVREVPIQKQAPQSSSEVIVHQKDGNLVRCGSLILNLAPLGTSSPTLNSQRERQARCSWALCQIVYKISVGRVICCRSGGQS